MSTIISIDRKGRPCLVIPTKVSDLDLSMCSKKFIENELPQDTIVYVKCHENGEFDLRCVKGDRTELRIIPNKEILGN